MNTLFKLISKAFLLLLLCLVILPAMIYNTKLNHNVRLGTEIYNAIDNSNCKVKNGTIIVLGDSAAHQLYFENRYNDKIYSLASNQAISLAGQYILLHNILTINKIKISKVYLVMHPNSFRNNLDQIYVYNYFLKPFYKIENISLLTEDTKIRISNIPLYYIAKLPLVQATDYSPDLPDFEDPNAAVAASKTYKISSVSIEYLKMMSTDLKTMGIEFEVVSPILNDDIKTYDIGDFRKKIDCNNLKDVFKNYFNFKYIPKNYFVDMVHYSNPKEFGLDPLHLAPKK